VELSLSTFILEIVNFLILVWILKRFLYKPVLAALARRKSKIDESLSEAARRQEHAQSLEKQYQNRLTEWQQEKERLRNQLEEEINSQRKNLMDSLDKSLANQREKARVLEQRELEQFRRQASERGAAQGVAFTSRLLQRLASAELEKKLVMILQEDLQQLPEEQLRQIRSAGTAASGRVKITSAFPLEGSQREALAGSFRQLLGGEAKMEFLEDASLLAGLRVSIGPWVLRANLHDELDFFSQAAQSPVLSE
jgi:F-type H+-transporting ATPase subunit b